MSESEVVTPPPPLFERKFWFSTFRCSLTLFVGARTAYNVIAAARGYRVLGPGCLGHHRTRLNLPLLRKNDWGF